MHAVCAVLGIRHPEPDRFADPAVGRLTVTSPHEEETFRSLNEGLPYADRVRPWNFLMTAHPDWRERRRGCQPSCRTAREEQEEAKECDVGRSLQSQH